MSHCKPAQVFFAIIFEGRTGSSHLVSCLNSHPQVLCYPEILASLRAGEQNALLNALVQGKPINSKAWYSPYFATKNKVSDVLQAVGFKTKLHQVCDLFAFQDFLCYHQFKLIYLKRQNIVKSVLSLLNARRLYKRHRALNARNENQVQGPLYIAPEMFVRELHHRVQVERAHEIFFDIYVGEKQLCFYEDLLNNPQWFFSQICHFLGVPIIEPKSAFLKNTPDDLSLAIKNYPEIRQLLSNTCFAPLLTEPSE